MKDKVIRIRFITENDYDKFIYKILQGIQIEKYKWYVRKNDIVSISQWNINVQNADDQEIFIEHYYTGQEFMKEIIKDEYYIVSGEFFAYFPEERIDENIRTYQDYVRSDCQIVIFGCDGCYFDVYSKDKEIIKIIEQNCKDNHYTEIEPFTEKNNPRTKMWV